MGGDVQFFAQLGLFAIFGKGQAVDRADVDAGVALDALVLREYRLDIAVEAALRLVEGGRRVESKFDLHLAVAQRLGKIGVGHGLALVFGDEAGIAPIVDAHLLADEVGAGIRPGVEILPVEHHVDRQRGLVPVRHGGNHIFGAECGVASKEYFRVGRLEGGAVDDRHIPFAKIQAEIAFDPREGIRLSDGNQHVVALDKSLLARGYQLAPAAFVENRLHLVE